MDSRIAWASNMVDNMLINDHNFWQNVFQQMEHQAKKTAHGMDGPFIFHGEVDCPEEMLYHPTVTLKQVQHVGKTNWIEDLEGRFFTVNDATLDELFSCGKIIRDPYHVEREYDRLNSIGEKIRYRVEHQHITERMAREIISEEIGHSLFAYTYTFEVTEINDGKDYPEQTSVHNIEADSEAEAYQLLAEDWIRPVGFIIQEGYSFAERCNIRTVVIKNIINLIDVVSNF